MCVRFFFFLPTARSFWYLLKPSRKRNAYAHTHRAQSLTGRTFSYSEPVPRTANHTNESHILSHSLALSVRAPTHTLTSNPFKHSLILHTRLVRVTFIRPFPLHILSSTRQTAQKSKRKTHTHTQARDRGDTGPATGWKRDSEQQTLNDMKRNDWEKKEEKKHNNNTQCWNTIFHSHLLVLAVKRLWLHTNNKFYAKLLYSLLSVLVFYFFFRWIVLLVDIFFSL